MESFSDENWWMEVDEYDQMSTQQLKALVNEGGLSQTTKDELLQIYIRKVDEKNARILESDGSVSSKTKKILTGEERKKQFEEWGALCRHEIYSPTLHLAKLSLSPGTVVMKRVGESNAINMSPLTQEEAEFGIEQNYAVPIRTLDPINGKLFCKTGEYVIAETSYVSVKQAAFENLTKVKYHLMNDKAPSKICEHIENFERGEYYCMNEAVPLEIYSTSVFPPEQVRCYFRRTRPCVGARRQLQSMAILQGCEQELDAKWDKFESSVAEFEECVPPDRNVWQEMAVGGWNNPEDVTCKCMKCIKEKGPGGKAWRNTHDFNRHKNSSAYQE